MPEHTPGPCSGGHVNQQLRELSGCRQPTPLQPLVVKVMVDNSCKRVKRQNILGCSDRARQRAQVLLVHRGKLEGTNVTKSRILVFLCTSPSPATPHRSSPCRGSNIALHMFKQMSPGTMPACWVTAQFPQTSAKAKANAPVIPPALHNQVPSQQAVLKPYYKQHRESAALLSAQEHNWQIKTQTFPFEIRTSCTPYCSVSPILSHQPAARPWKTAASWQVPNGHVPNAANEAQGMLLQDPAGRICPSFLDLRSCASDSQTHWPTALTSSVPAGPGVHIYYLACQELIQTFDFSILEWTPDTHQDVQLSQTQPIFHLSQNPQTNGKLQISQKCLRIQMLKTAPDL